LGAFPSVCRDFVIPANANQRRSLNANQRRSLNANQRRSLNANQRRSLNANQRRSLAGIRKMKDWMPVADPVISGDQVRHDEMRPIPRSLLRGSSFSIADADFGQIVWGMK
jgi:hypothetical protein